MKIEIHNGLQHPQILEVSRVLIMDQFGNPVVIAVEIDKGVILTETADHPVALNGMLRNLGINKTVIVEDVKQTSLVTIR